MRRSEDSAAALASLRAGRRGLLVVAHPDDETLALGGQLPELPDVTVLHLTTGAPRDPCFARAAGFQEREEYARARQRELAQALALAGVARERRRSLELPDQDASLHLVEITRALTAIVRDLRPAVVLSHAYEGGHPDHDAAAFAVSAIARLLGRSAPLVLEMPLYHRTPTGELRTGTFIDPAMTDQPSPPFHTVALEGAALARKEAMLLCFESQRDVIAAFEPRIERFRVAPLYDFARAPHRGSLHYETLGWRASFRDQQRLLIEAARALGLGESA